MLFGKRTRGAWSPIRPIRHPRSRALQKQKRENEPSFPSHQLLKKYYSSPARNSLPSFPSSTNKTDCSTNDIDFKNTSLNLETKTEGSVSPHTKIEESVKEETPILIGKHSLRSHDATVTAIETDNLVSSLVEIKFCGQSVFALMDSGCSSVSLIREDVAEKMDCDLKRVSVNLRLADGKGSMEAKYMAEGIISIGELTATHNFLVVKSLCAPMLWGTDIFVKLQLSLDFEKRGVVKNGKLLTTWVDDSHSVHVAANFVIEPFCHQFLPVKIDTMRDGDFIIEGGLGDSIWIVPTLCNVVK